MFRPHRLVKDASVLSRSMSTLQRQTPATVLLPQGPIADHFRVSDKVYGLRRQHQLAEVDDSLHREALKMFVEALHLRVARSTPQVPRQRIVTAQALQPQPITETPEQVTENKTNQSKSPESNQAAREARKETDTSNLEQLRTALREKNYRTALHLYSEAKGKNQLISRNILAQLFYMVSYRDPIKAYRILQDYHKHPATSKPKLNLYLRFCDSISSLRPQGAHYENMHRFIKRVITDLQEMDIQTQKELYPKLVVALGTQRCVTLGPYAGRLYTEMILKNFNMSPGWLRKVLSLSKYNRKDDIPFDNVLSQLAEQRARPHPFSTIAAVHNMFPFTDPDKTCTSLQALLSLQNVVLEDSMDSESKFDAILIDMDCLESIAMGAAHSGCSEQILLVWELLEQCNYKPTETIYESTIVAFISSLDHIENAFEAVVAMKEEGFDVSRSLMRSISLAIRSKPKIIYGSYYLLQERSELVSLESLNMIMSCFAERGDAREANGVLDFIRGSGISPNIDTFSFCLEALGKDIHRREKRNKPGAVRRNIHEASRYLTMMEREGLSPSSDVVRNYIELLCMAGEVETATSVLKECMENIPTAVNSKSLYRVAISNAEAGDFETAHELANLIDDNIPSLWRKMRSIQQRHKHLKGEDDI